MQTTEAKIREPFLPVREWVNAALALAIVLSPIIILSALAS